MSEDNFIDMEKGAEVILNDGKTLRIKYCSFADFLTLKSVVLKNLKIKIDKNFINKKIDASFLTELIEPIIGLIGERELDEILLKLSSLCLLDGEKLTRDFFERPQNRKYYFESMFHILAENIKVFFPTGTFIK
jgi:hypothetical protein